jgi:predicted MFS family arabinose efflux permease
VSRAGQDSWPVADRDSNRFGAVTIGFLALAAALATSTSYVIQPELIGVAGDLGSTVPTVTVVAGSAIAAYLLGLAVLVPLVGQLRSNRLVAGQLAGLTAGMVVAAAAQRPLALDIGLFVSGMCASTGAQMSTLAGKHTSSPRQSRAVGSVTAGIAAGILLGRIAGGALADRIGWRHIQPGARMWRSRSRPVGIYHHPVGTCRTGPADDPDAVVDLSGPNGTATSW